MRDLLRASIVPAVLVLVVFLGTAPAAGQLNTAYTEGYKPMLELAGPLREMEGSAVKRADFSAVKSLASNYISRLDRVIAGMENVGRNFKDGDNEGWGRATRSATLAQAKVAKGKAEQMRARADNSLDSQAQVIELQKSLTDLSDEFKKCWELHERRLRETDDNFRSVFQRWFDATKDDRRPLDELAKKAGERRDRANEVRKRADELSNAFSNALDLSDRARTEMLRNDPKLTPDEVRAKYEAWKKTDDLVLAMGKAVKTMDEALDAAEKAYDEARNEHVRAVENYQRETAEGDQLYQIVRSRHQRAYEMHQEYKSFSW